MTWYHCMHLSFLFQLCNPLIFFVICVKFFLSLLLSLSQKQQSQIGYPALACLPPSVANPPTTLPPQYEPNLPQSYSPSLAGSLQSFGCAAGLIPPQFNQGLIALDMPMSAATASSSSSSPALLPQSKLNMGGFDPNRFMVGGPIPGSLPNHEVARAIGGMGMPLVVAGRNEPGGAGGIVEGSSGEGGNGYKRQRKRTYSQTNQDMQQGIIIQNVSISNKK